MKYEDFTKVYRRARWEHAFRLRNEGLKWKEIGHRLGIGFERARQLNGRYVREQWASDRKGIRK
jgi:hypothetical protein